MREKNNQGRKSLVLSGEPLAGRGPEGQAGQCVSRDCNKVRGTQSCSCKSRVWRGPYTGGAAEAGGSANIPTQLSLWDGGTRSPRKGKEGAGFIAGLFFVVFF